MRPTTRSSGSTTPSRTRPTMRRLTLPALLLSVMSWGAAGVATQALVPAPAAAQVSRADSAAVLLDTARDFEAVGEHAVARALYRYILQHFPDSDAAAQARALLSASRPSTPGSGETELQVWSTLYGLWLGVAVPGALGVDGSEPYGVGLLLGGPAGFFAGRAVARRKEITLGQARAITLGGTWGTIQGFGWRAVLDIGEGFECELDLCVSDGAGEESFALGLAGGVVGLTAGALLARRPISDGAASGANFGVFWGSWIGTAAGIIADFEDDGVLASALVAGNAGLAAMALSADDLGWSRSRWRVVNVAGILGGLGGLGIDLLAQPDDERVAVAIPLVASLVGLGVGIHTTRDDPGDEGADDVGLAGALLGYRDGALSFGGVTPMPTLLRLEGPRGTEWKPAVGVTLFRALF